MGRKGGPINPSLDLTSWGVKAHNRAFLWGWRDPFSKPSGGPAEGEDASEDEHLSSKVQQVKSLRLVGRAQLSIRLAAPREPRRRWRTGGTWRCTSVPECCDLRDQGGSLSLDASSDCKSATSCGPAAPLPLEDLAKMGK